MASFNWKNANPGSKVEGPIRCHTCRLVCRDAEHYLGHKCQSVRLDQASVRRLGANIRPQLANAG